MKRNPHKELAKGAEAIIYQGRFLNFKVILKKRVPKLYRLPEIDYRIRTQRLRSEAKTMVSAWQCGVRVPELLGIDLEKTTLICKFIEGDLLYTAVRTHDSIQNIFFKVGEEIAHLHANDLIHGDLTVFNVIVTEKLIPYIIDFGLGGFSGELERKADDLLTFYSTLKAITPKNKQLFENFKQGYINGYSEGIQALEQMRKIMSRARYIARENRLE